METKSNLLDASDNAIAIIGAIDIPITVSPHLPTIRQRFMFSTHNRTQMFYWEETLYKNLEQLASILIREKYDWVHNG